MVLVTANDLLRNYTTSDLGRIGFNSRSPCTRLETAHLFTILRFSVAAIFWWDRCGRPRNDMDDALWFRMATKFPITTCDSVLAMINFLVVCMIVAIANARK